MSSKIALSPEEMKLIMEWRNLKAAQEKVELTFLPVSRSREKKELKRKEKVFLLNKNPIRLSSAEMEFLEELKDLLIQTGANIVFYELAILKILRRYVEEISS